MTPVLTPQRTRPPDRSALSVRLTALVAAVVLGGLGTFSLLRSLQGPAFVDGVTVVNRTEYRFDVGVAGGDDEGVIGLGTLGRDAEKRFEAVLDQGDVWVFHFHYGGVEGGRFSVPRGQLEAADWTVDIPASAGQRLRASGMAPSAQYL